ncbi:MAG: hypothetical protein ACI9D5_002908 [Candidatus Endobugula sp.]|jgi:hypothetical protein
MKPPSINLTHELTELLKPFVDVSGQPLKLIIHAGTPKTGTTSIQSYLVRIPGHAEHRFRLKMNTYYDS